MDNCLGLLREAKPRESLIMSNQEISATAVWNLTSAVVSKYTAIMINRHGQQFGQLVYDAVSISVLR
jgi:hypothetical protein